MANQVWFSIIPKKDVAKAIVNDSRNQEHVVITEAGRKVFQVVFGAILKEDCILSFGRHEDNDIKCDLPGTPFGRSMA